MTLPPDLLAPILTRPDDDLPRLIAADWLEENGQGEWAEFIRSQIESEESDKNQRRHQRRLCEIWDGENRNGLGYQFDLPPLQSRMGWEKCDGETEIIIVRRGWPDEIRCTMAQWVGEYCQRCGGHGSAYSDQHGEIVGTCPNCNRTGRTPGIAGRVMKEWPVTKVVLTDKSPMDASDGYSWHLSDHFHQEELPFELPKCIYWKLKASKKFNKYGSKMDGLIVYPTEKRAHAALSSAAIAFGLREAGRG